MKISYNWLQSYFDEKLPPPKKLAELLTFSFAEIENIERTGDDAVLDIKVLPDRACYALSHRGVAYEVSAILGIPKKKVEYPLPEIKKVRPLSVLVEAPELCSRYMARVVEGVTQKNLPWVKEHLEAVRQRMIHPVVDGANIVMFDTGQPLHAFDADKVEGGIVVRRARKGEKIITLDNQEVVLDEAVLVIADEKSPLAVAGIKGGMKAAVTPATRNLILESASFNASYIRKASERLGIKTDASKRFENKLSPSLVSVGMNDFTAFLFEMDKNLKAGKIVDWYPDKLQVTKLKVKREDITKKLGLDISDKEIESVFSRLEIVFERKGDTWMLTLPTFRVDLAIPEDIAEEVGRIIGYDKILSVLPPKQKGAVEIPKPFSYEWKIREILVGAGFSEIMTSSFSEKGSVAIEKPLAEDKKYARPNLRGSFAKALKVNALNAPLFGTDESRIFEIGQVFPKEGERTALAIGYSGLKKNKNQIQEVLAQLKEAGIEIFSEEKDGVFEGFLSTRPGLLTKWDISIPSPEIDKFIPFSVYPFIVRDVAFFVEADDVEEKVRLLVFEMAKKSAGRLLIKGPLLFDTFEKDGEKSFAFRLVFQSFEKTLTDEEVNGFMEKIYSAVKSKEWKVR